MLVQDSEKTDYETMPTSYDHVPEFVHRVSSEADLRHKHEENQGFIQPMCEACVERIKINPDIYVFSVYSLELKELNTPEEENGD